jgi:hypothetical protein
MFTDILVQIALLRVRLRQHEGEIGPVATGNHGRRAPS